jgi:cell division protein FtsB
MIEQIKRHTFSIVLIALAVIVLVFIVQAGIGVVKELTDIKNQQQQNTEQIEQNKQQIERQAQPCGTEDLRHPEASPGCDGYGGAGASQ